VTGWRLRALARDDLAAIWTFTAERWGSAQAERYLGALFDCFDDLAANPRLGRSREELGPGYRSFPQGRHVVFYELGRGGLEILAIVHQGEDLEVLPGRD
jgi:toxin ParE1/3/4